MAKIKNLRICPRWLYCKMVGDICFHMAKHRTMPSCDQTDLKGNFGKTGMDSLDCPEEVVCATIDGDTEPLPYNERLEMELEARNGTNKNL